MFSRSPSVEVDRQFSQLDAVDRNLEEASNSCGVGIIETRVSEDKNLQLGQGHNELGDVVVVQLEEA